VNPTRRSRAQTGSQNDAYTAGDEFGLASGSNLPTQDQIEFNSIKLLGDGYEASYEGIRVFGSAGSEYRHLLKLKKCEDTAIVRLVDFLRTFP
jgi:hypothetical protein